MQARPALIPSGSRSFIRRQNRKPIICRINRKNCRHRLDNESVQITNRYIIGKERSFTIIAFPVPEIGADFPEIFKETIRINTLDYQLYADIQQKLIDATKNKFTQETYKDEENGVSLDYNLFIPADYDASVSYPLIMFIPDSSAAGKSSEEVLSQYYGADIWASDDEQAKHTSFVFCPVFSETVVDDDFNTSNQIDTAVKVLNQLMEDYNIDTSRVYTTGQSMGCMTSLYLNSLYPDLFAASLFVSGQWDINILKPLENKKFFYVTCTGDQKASSGQTEVMDLFKKRRCFLFLPGKPGSRRIC